MPRGLLVGAAGLALVGAVALWATPHTAAARPAANAPCEVILRGSGTYRLTVGTGGPVPVVDFRKAYGPRFDGIRLQSGNFRDCNHELGELTINRSPNASPLLYHVARELYTLARTEWQTSQRPQVEYAYRDFGNLSAAVQREMLMVGFRQVMAGIASDLIKRYANPADFLTDKGAKWVAETAVKLMMEAYVEGRDPGLIIDGLLTRMVDHLKSQVDGLAKSVGGPELALLLKPQLEGIATEVKKLLVEAQPDGQTVWIESTVDDCTHFLYLVWNFKGGTYNATMTIRCGPRQPDSIRRVEATSITLEPGAAGAVTAQALSQLGVPLPLATATVVGIAPVPPAGSGEPAAVIATGQATFNFAAANPRRDADFPYDVDLLTSDVTGRLAGKGRGVVTVANVAPSIDATTPAEASAEPGRILSLDGALLSVTDRNADSDNAGEVSASSISLSHPAGLRTTPRFDRAENPVRLSHDGGSGAYQFRFTRSGRVEDPHPHGTWPAVVTIADNNGAAATASIALTVEDVAPEVGSVLVTPAFVRRGQGRQIQVVVRVRDGNEAADITGVTVDARAAGGAVYTLDDGLVETGRGSDWIELTLAQPFPQSDVEGEHPIVVTVADEANTGTGTGSLHVGNTAPTSSGWGYLHGFDPEVDSTGSTDDLDVKQRVLCPRVPFRAGMIARDAEGDALLVTGVIVETGATAIFRETSPGIFIGEMLAPDVPGDYTLRLTAVEQDPSARSVVVEMPLKVEPCEPEDDSSRAALGEPVNATDIATAPRDPAIQLGMGALSTTIIAPAMVPAGTGDERRPNGPSVELLDTLEALLRSATGVADPLETYVLATGGSTGPVAQLFAINRGDRPLRLLPTAVVLEPVVMSPAIQARVTEVLRRYVAAGGSGAVLDFYCLEFLRRAPAAGTLLRIAGGGVAAPFMRHAQILEAARRLMDAGELLTALDPLEYLHGVRQWAIWSVEERFDLSRFTDAYLTVSRRNLEEAGERWGADAEREARGLVPGLWNDVRSVLREAGLDPARTGEP